LLVLNNVKQEEGFMEFIRKHVVWLSIYFFVSGMCFSLLAADNKHWSMQFPKPQSTTKMTGKTGMSDGTGAPTINIAKWHRGKLYMAGRWENSLNPNDPGRKKSNYIWYLWTWHPTLGYEAISWRHTAQGGPGPHGIINDFLFLPDGRLVIGGEFKNIGNLNGHTYHRVKGLAVYNPKEPTANRWQPLVSSVQHNSPGNIQTLAYDPQANDLWVGGSFKGFRMEKMEQFAFGVQRYDFDSKQWKIMVPGVRGGRGLRKIKVDTSTKPSTIYMAGRFTHTDGNGIEPRESNGTSRYSVGFAAWKEDIGWITFPKKSNKKLGKEGPLQRAADFAFFDSVNIFDFLIDGKDIWVVGAFSEGKTSDGKPLRGIAKWDHAQQMWIDPTGKGGLGREAYAITKAADGKIYIAGAFGGLKSGNKFFDGFKNGEKAHMAISYDPKTKKWEQLGDGLGGYSMPVVKVMAHGNDVFFYGTFRQIGQKKNKKKESYFLARWNSKIDFSKGKAPLPKGADKPFTISEPGIDAPMIKEGMEHWSRVFKHPPRMSGGKTKQSATTGMDDGVGQPDVKGLKWHKGILYIAGSWEVMKNERWFVWTYDPKKGYAPLGFKKKTKDTGWNSPPEGLNWHNNKLYVWGANNAYKGIATWDPKSKKWSKITGKYEGKPVIGNAIVQGNPAINDVKWDSKTGDMYMIGSTGLRYKKGNKGGTVPSSVIRVDKKGNYHAMGMMLIAQIPSKPIKGIYTMFIDETKTPSDLYIGGTFGTWGADSNHKNLAYNVAKWSYQKKDWQPIGKGVFRKIGMHDKKIFPDGYPGLPAQPVYGYPTFLTDLFPRVRVMTMDKAGNLFAGGSLGILDDNPDVTKRIEHYGIVKYDQQKDEWVPCTTSGGISRDVFDMTWLDDRRLLLSGGFLYSEDYNQLNNVAILDTQTQRLSSLAGGLYKGHSGHVLSMNVHHTVNKDGYWFGGFFKYAGVDKNSLSQGTIESNYIAHYNPNAKLDPNAGLIIVPPAPIKGVKGYSSKSRKVTLQAKGITKSKGTVIWYTKKSNGKFKKAGQGLKYKANVRVKGGMKNIIFYVAVKRTDGTEGSKIPLTVIIQPPK